MITKKYALFFVFITMILNTSFAQLAKSKGKWLGNVVNSNTPSTFNTYWNQVTPENGTKWGSVENAQNQMRWANSDLIYQLSREQKIPFKFHTFVWGQQEPAFLKNLLTNELTAEVESWIQQACERYPDMEFIDVVNEPLHAPPSYKHAIGGDGTTKWDWVIWAFEKARKYCPKAKLLLNDYSILNSDASTTKFIEIIELLKSRNLIDGIGEQGHFFETTPINTIKNNLTRLANTGLPIYISEFDVHIANDNDQLNKYKELFPLFWEHPSVKGITLWGYLQGQIWRTNAYLIRSDGTDRPAMTWLKDYVALSTSNKEIHLNVLEAKIITNPVRNNTLQVWSDARLHNIEIYTLEGKKVFDKRINQSGILSIDLSLPANKYVLKIIGQKSFKTEKIVVE